MHIVHMYRMKDVVCFQLPKSSALKSSLTGINIECRVLPSTALEK